MWETARDISVVPGEEPYLLFLSSDFVGFNSFPCSLCILVCRSFHMGSGPKPLEADGKTPTDLSRPWMKPHLLGESLLVLVCILSSYFSLHKLQGHFEALYFVGG